MVFVAAAKSVAEPIRAAAGDLLGRPVRQGEPDDHREQPQCDRRGVSVEVGGPRREEPGGGNPRSLGEPLEAGNGPYQDDVVLDQRGDRSGDAFRSVGEQRTEGRLADGFVEADATTEPRDVRF